MSEEQALPRPFNLATDIVVKVHDGGEVDPIRGEEFVIVLYRGAAEMWASGALGELDVRHRLADSGTPERDIKTAILIARATWTKQQRGVVSAHTESEASDAKKRKRPRSK